MVSLQLKQEIITRSIFNGESQRSIAKELGIHRKTVKKYIEEYNKAKFILQNSDLKEDVPLIIEKMLEKPKYNTTNRANRKITDELIEKVRGYLKENEKKKTLGQQKQVMNRTIIHEELLKEGFEIGYTSTALLINKLTNKGKEAYIKQEYGYGEICEFDWGEVKIIVNGKLKVYQMAVFTMAKENYRYAVIFNKQNTQSFQEAHALFFNHIGGVPVQMVYDNMKVAVKRFVGKREKEATEGLLKLSMYYGFSFRFCNIASGNEKGHVEKSVGYIRTHAFSTRDEFQNIEEANKYLLEKCQEFNLKPRKEEKNETAVDLLKISKEFLLPAVAMFECAEKKELRVDKYSTVLIDSCHYSVEEQYVGKMITAKVYPEKIICFYENENIGEHEKKHGFNEWSIKLEHYLKTLMKKPGALAGSTALNQANNLVKSIYNQYYRTKPKEFVELILYILEKDKKISEIYESIEKLLKLGVKEITTELIKNISESRKIKEVIKEEGEIERQSKEQLKEISNLLTVDISIGYQEVASY